VIELFPEFRKEKIPIGRFLCRKEQATFSLLPIQLTPYFQYTVSAVIGTLLLAFQCRQMGQQGFFGASIGVDSESLVTPWIIVCWLGSVARGLRRAHRVLNRFYDLSGLGTSEMPSPWEEVSGYFLAFGWTWEIVPKPKLLPLLTHYSRSTRQFLFGRTSQQRVAIGR